MQATDPRLAGPPAALADRTLGTWGPRGLNRRGKFATLQFLRKPHLAPSAQIQHGVACSSNLGI